MIGRVLKYKYFYINKIHPKWHVAIMETKEYRTYLQILFSRARIQKYLVTRYNSAIFYVL